MTSDEVIHKYLSDKEEAYLATIGGESPEDIKNADKGLKEKFRDYLGYFISYDNLFSTWKKDVLTLGAKTVSEALEDFYRNLNDAYRSVFAGIFSALERGVSKLGENAGSRDKAVRDIVSLVDLIPPTSRDYEKRTIEDDVRDHLRGFSRTIPSFLMAYGTDKTTLVNFDQIIPDQVFKDVTSITLAQFRFLRDGGDYYERDDQGNEIRDEEHKKHFEGKLFDEVVFDDSIKEFLNKKRQLADYFDDTQKEDIFDYIPPQKTNQIFTPRKIVREMVDQLETENPGCFDQDDKTFVDLYMKSGMYITEIVKRLYNSPRLKMLYPDDKVRLNHIFAKQVYGLAPMQIIYNICLSYILGFSNEIEIDKHNIRLCDALEYAKNGTLEMKLEELFPELKDKGD